MSGPLWAPSEALADDIGVPGVPSCLLDQVEDNPAYGAVPVWHPRRCWQGHRSVKVSLGCHGGVGGGGRVPVVVDHAGDGLVLGELEAGEVCLHRHLVAGTSRWGAAGAGQVAGPLSLDAFLLARAMEQDAPGVVLALACDWLRNGRIVRPSVDTLSRRVAAARDGARAETYHRLASLLAPPRPTSLLGR